MIAIGLTGSIGMGKSTVAQMFAALGVKIWDADAAVHRIYAPGGKAVEPVKKAFPNVISNNDTGEFVDRNILAQIVLEDSQALKKLESIVHPLVADDRQAFFQEWSRDEEAILVFDIPLLFENNSESMFDAVVVVSADLAVQRKRVLDRPGMTEEKFNQILARQLPDKEKRQRADYVIRTDTDLETTNLEVQLVYDDIKQKFLRN